jgi:FkbM family methyltransferase
MSSSHLLLKKVRIALTPRSRLLRTRLQNGALVDGYNRPGYGIRSVYLYGDSIEPELLYLQRFLGSGSVFVDVGANVGIYAVKAAKEVGRDGLVVAVEPFIETAYRLSQNVAMNGYRNVRIRNLCIGSSTQQEQLYLNKNRPVSFGMLPVGNAESISVLSVTFDDLCRWEKLERLDYLKIDAEGAETEILQGAQWAITQFRPIVQVEITKRDCALSLNYRRFAAPDSPNVVFIPAENAKALQTAIDLEWAEMPAGD